MKQKPDIEIRHQTKTQHHVKIKAGKYPKPYTVDHLLVQDVLAFAKALENAQAPLDGQVNCALVRNTALIDTLAVYWDSNEDLINGEPAPQAKEQDKEKAS